MDTTCSITFQNNSNSYKPGQHLSVCVRFTFLKHKTIRGIYIKFIGFGQCKWEEKKRRGTQTYSQNQYYLNVHQYLMGSDSDKIQIQPQSFNYDFLHCSLPNNLPSTLHTDIGSVHYKVVVGLRTPLFGKDKTYSRTFYVVKPVNLNDYPDLRCPVVVERIKSMHPHCLLACFPYGPIELSVRIPVSGYVPGQVIQFNIDVNNMSNLDVQITAKLVKLYSYTDGTHETEISQTICKHVNVAVVPVSVKQSYRCEFLVPPTEPTEMTKGNCCQLMYYLSVSAKVTGRHTNPTVRIPIRIGMCPLTDEDNVTLVPFGVDIFNNLEWETFCSNHAIN